MKLKLDHILQFKVTLKGLRPPVWRRIQVPCNYSFWDFHVAIQDGMGWLDSHLHLFDLSVPLIDGNVQVGIPLDDGFDFGPPVLPGWELPIAEFLTLANRKAKYDYDFGDGWRHSILLEKILPITKGLTYPRCVGGKRACPPEDCGGVWGYQNLLEVLADPENEEHQGLLEWLGGQFDSERFDPASVHFDDPEARWKRAFK